MMLGPTQLYDPQTFQGVTLPVKNLRKEFLKVFKSVSLSLSNEEKLDLTLYTLVFIAKTK